MKAHTASLWPGSREREERVPITGEAEATVRARGAGYGLRPVGATPMTAAP